MSARRQTGFTLIEVVIAFAIFALCAGALAEVFSAAVRRSAQSRDRELAWLTAQSVLAELRATPAPWKPEQAGRSTAGASWRVAVEPYEPGMSAQTEWQALKVTVRVRSDRAGAREVLLESVELARRPR